MTVRFHETEDQSAYAERVLTLLVQAALPQVMEQLNHYAGRKAAKHSTVARNQK